MIINFRVIPRIKQIVWRHFLSKENYARKIGVTIGERCKISTKEWGSEPFLITIGNHSHITSNVRFINHDGGVWIFRDEIPDFDVFGKISIGNNTYIGNNTVILPGVTIGNNCVVGANSVVTKSIPDGSVTAGVPAKFLMSTDDYKIKLLKNNAKTKNYRTLENEKEVFRNLPDNIFIKKGEMVKSNSWRK